MSMTEMSEIELLIASPTAAFVVRPRGKKKVHDIPDLRQAVELECDGSAALGNN